MVDLDDSLGTPHSLRESGLGGGGSRGGVSGARAERYRREGPTDSVRRKGVTPFDERSEGPANRFRGPKDLPVRGRPYRLIPLTGEGS